MATGLTPSTRSHSPRVREGEPPLGKAALPLGKKLFGEAFRRLRVPAQEVLEVFSQQRLPRLGAKAKQARSSRYNFCSGRPAHERAQQAAPLTLITSGRTLSKVFGASSGSVTSRGRAWAQTVQLAGTGSDSLCSQL